MNRLKKMIRVVKIQTNEIVLSTDSDRNFKTEVVEGWIGSTSFVACDMRSPLFRTVRKLEIGDDCVFTKDNICDSYGHKYFPVFQAIMQKAKQ